MFNIGDTTSVDLMLISADTWCLYPQEAIFVENTPPYLSEWD